MSNKQYWDRIEKAGHVLKRDEDGGVDYFAFEFEFHNGPLCVLCGDTWCHHCEDEIEPCDHADIHNGEQQ